LPPGKRFEFIIEKDKLENIKKVIASNHGRVLEETHLENNVQMKVEKTGD
jgi:hypothetical protein